MRNLLFGVLSSVLFVTSCATPASGTSSRPNSARAMEDVKQAQPKDPRNYVSDPTIGTNPPQDTQEKPLCRLQCGPNLHCDASGFVERCVPNEERKP
jgi:hypothetical protein